MVAQVCLFLGVVVFCGFSPSIFLKEFRILSLWGICWVCSLQGQDVFIKVNNEEVSKFKAHRQVFCGKKFSTESFFCI